MMNSRSSSSLVVVQTGDSSVVGLGNNNNSGHNPDLDDDHTRLVNKKEIDASINTWCWVAFLPCTFGALPYKTTLLLDEQEIVKTDVDLCGTRISRRLYSDLGSIDRSTCLCWVSAEFATNNNNGSGGSSSSSHTISPGCGCNRQAVDDITNELRARILQHRSQHNNYERQDKSNAAGSAAFTLPENTVERLNQVESKLDLIIDHLQIPKTKMIERV